jgi:integrase
VQHRCRRHQRQHPDHDCRELAAIIDATPTGHLTLLVTKTGKSYGANDFSEQFRKWCDDAGLPPECSFHGLRKAALTRLADAGCTAHQIAAISGHKTLKEIERYTKAADQARLAREAMARAAAARQGCEEKFERAFKKIAQSKRQVSK